MSEVLELPRIDEALIDTPAPARTDVAVAAAAAAGPAIDLAKVDLAQLAIAKLGDWRPVVAKLKADNTNTVHDLSTQTKVDDAVSLRSRTVNVPLALARKTEKALASAMTQARKKLGTELEALEAGYADAVLPLTKQIDDAQKKLDDEKEAKRKAEEDRLAGLRATVDDIMARWIARCMLEGITAVRIGMGIGMLQELAMPPEAADVAAHWTTAKAATLAAMATLEREAAHREQEARLEDERVEIARQRWELLHQQMDVAAAAAALRVGFGPVGDVRASFLTTHGPRDQWTELSVGQAYVQAMGLLQPQPAVTEIHQEAKPSGEGTAVTPGAGNAEAAPIQRSDSGGSRAAPVTAPPGPVCRGDFPDGPEATCAMEQGREDTAQDAGLAPGSLHPTTEEQQPRQVLKAEPATADATDRGTAADASPVGGPVGAGQPAAAGPAGDPSAELALLAKEARGGKFPSQPKVSTEWWSRFYAVVDSLVAEAA